MRVICVKHGDKYGADWVIKLSRMVARNLPIDYEFVCMTDKPVPRINCIPLLSELPGWWAKLALFKPGALPGDNLYLDLDVIITDSLLPLVALLYQSPGLWARDDFSYSLKNPRKGLSEDTKRMLGGDGCVNSSVMLWRGDVARAAWDEFKPEVMNVLHGDQNFVSQVLWPEGIRLIPDEMICSYKYDVQRKNAKPAPIVVFHGDPKADQLGHRDPLRVIWES